MSNGQTQRALPGLSRAPAQTRSSIPTVAALAYVLSLLLLLSLPAFAPRAAASGGVGGCAISTVFRPLQDAIPQIVGTCVEYEHADAATGNVVQATTGGLLVLRKSDNLATFTDGYRTWVSGPGGVVQRLNQSRFPFERDPSAPALPSPAVTAAPTLAAAPTATRPAVVATVATLAVVTPTIAGVQPSPTSGGGPFSGGATVAVPTRTAAPTIAAPTILAPTAPVSTPSAPSRSDQFNFLPYFLALAALAIVLALATLRLAGRREGAPRPAGGAAAPPPPADIAAAAVAGVEAPAAPVVAPAEPEVVAPAPPSAEGATPEPAAPDPALSEEALPAVAPVAPPPADQITPAVPAAAATPSPAALAAAQTMRNEARQVVRRYQAAAEAADDGTQALLNALSEIEGQGNLFASAGYGDLAGEAVAGAGLVFSATEARARQRVLAATGEEELRAELRERALPEIIAAATALDRAAEAYGVA